MFSAKLCCTSICFKKSLLAIRLLLEPTLAPGSWLKQFTFCLTWIITLLVWVVAETPPTWPWMPIFYSPSSYLVLVKLLNLSTADKYLFWTPISSSEKDWLSQGNTSFSFCQLQFSSCKHLISLLSVSWEVFNLLILHLTSCGCLEMGLVCSEWIYPSDHCTKNIGLFSVM